jgi:hypothetical protein
MNRREVRLSYIMNSSGLLHSPYEETEKQDVNRVASNKLDFQQGKRSSGLE